MRTLYVPNHFLVVFFFQYFFCRLDTDKKEEFVKRTLSDPKVPTQQITPGMVDNVVTKWVWLRICDETVNLFFFLFAVLCVLSSKSFSFFFNFRLDTKKKKELVNPNPCDVPKEPPQNITSETVDNTVTKYVWLCGKAPILFISFYYFIHTVF